MIGLNWLIQIGLIEWHLLVKTVSDEEFKCFQLEAFPLYPHFFEENETMHLQPYLPCLINNLFKNDTIKVLGPTKLDENLGFSFS